MLWVCVWLQACQGSLQQNSINCLDLSRLIILHSISFKQETSHFCLFSYHSPGQSVDNYSAVKDCRPPPHPPFNSLWQSFKNLTPPTYWSETWRHRLIFPLLISHTAAASTQEKVELKRKKKKKKPSTLFCLITFYRSEDNLKDNSLIRWHESINLLNASVRISKGKEVVIEEGWGGVRVTNSSLISKWNIFPD